MNSLRLSPLRWTLVSEADALTIAGRQRGGRDRHDQLAGGYRHAASIQSIFFAPGSISENIRIASALGRIGQPFPASAEAQQAFREVPEMFHFRFEDAAPSWYIRNCSTEDFSHRFGSMDMTAIFEMPDGPMHYSLSAEQVLPCLETIESLSGANSVDKIISHASCFGLERLVTDLLSRGGLMASNRTEAPDVEHLPEFLFFGHSSFAVRSGRALGVFDPVALPGNRLAGEPHRPLVDILRAADFVVISHHHWDHLHFQTICQLERDTLFVVPRVRLPTFSNPPVAAYLRSLGFSNIMECCPGEVVDIDGITLRFFPFHGEPFGLDSCFDGFTYHVTFSGKTLYGSVDACHDERGNMDDTIEEVRKMGDLDFFLFGSSGQLHEPPYAAGGLRHFSNELVSRPDLVRYHPTLDDVRKWVQVLKPRCLIPYAEFIFKGASKADLDWDDLMQRRRIPAYEQSGFSGNAARNRWFEQLRHFADQGACPVVLLSPMQGIRCA